MSAARNNISLNLPDGVPGGGGGRPDLPSAGEIDITKDRLGEIIGARRHQLGLKVEEIAEDIKIRADYLRAIEQEDFDSLPTPQYTRLFLKSYAERLGLNVSEIYALYDLHHRPPQEIVPKPRPGETVVPIVAPPRLPQPPRPDRTRLWLILVVGIIVVLTVAAILSRVIKGSGQTDETQGSVSDQQTTPAQNLADVAQTQTPPQPQPTAAAPDTVASDSSSQPVIDAEMRMTLTFTQDTWVRLVADADTIVNTVVRGGHSVEGKASNQFALSLGHTIGVEAAVNGHPLRPFSAWTKGFGGMVITADSVAAWMIPGAPTTTTGGGTQ